MAINLERLGAEFRATKEIDRLLSAQHLANESESIGVAFRIIRRQDILREMLAWIKCAEDSLKSGHTR
jgi:hypothetical protein